MNIGLLVLAASWLVKDHFGPWVSFHSEFLAFAGLAVMMVACLRRAPRGVIVPAVLLPAILIAAIPMLQFFCGITYFAGDAVVSTIYLAGFGIAIWVGHFANSGNQNSDRHKAIALAIAIPALLSAGIGWCQWFGVDDSYLNYVMSSPSGLASGNISQPNLHGTFLLMGLAAFVFLLHLRAVNIASFFLATFFLTGAIAMTQSRAAIVSAFVLTIFFAYKRKQFVPRFSAWHIGGWYIAYFCLRASMPMLGAALLFPSKKTLSLTDSSGRWEIWEQVSNAIFQAPWFGYGWNQTFRAQTAGAQIYPNEITYTYAHNVVLDLIAWNGIPLGLLVVALVSYWLLKRIRLAATPSSIFSVGVLLPIATHSVFEFPFAYANFLITAGLMVGIIESDLGTVKRFVVRKGFLLICSISFIVAGSWAVMEYIEVEEDYRIVRFENLRIGDTPSDYLIPRLALLTHLGAMLDSARIVPARGMTSQQIEMLREASHRFPYGLLMYKYAVSLSLNGRASDGVGQMTELKAIYGTKYYLQCGPAYLEATGQQLP